MDMPTKKAKQARMMKTKEISPLCDCVLVGEAAGARRTLAGDGVSLADGVIS